MNLVPRFRCILADLKGVAWPEALNSIAETNVVPSLQNLRQWSPRQLSGLAFTTGDASSAGLQEGQESSETTKVSSRRFETGPADADKRQKLQKRLEEGPYPRRALKALLMPAQGKNHFRRMWARQEQSKADNLRRKRQTAAMLRRRSQERLERWRLRAQYRQADFVNGQQSNAE
ncbi:hypothetical protein WJX73_004866 [Symbiochloris irregularis]|uniref:Uncharacterized protein n=1 Tax=Symbiochloris irregularis TaxID=706552 RepID=A0AAW1NZX3_9CHLO